MAKLKGRRMSVNVEKSLNFGRPRRKDGPSWFRGATEPGYASKMEAAAEEELSKFSSGSLTKQQKENIVHNYLNTIHKAGRTPMPSPRGKTPPKPKSPRTIDKKVTEYPGTHTSNATTKKWVSGMAKPAGPKPKSKYEAYVTPKDTGGKQGRVKKK